MTDIITWAITLFTLSTWPEMHSHLIFSSHMLCKTTTTNNLTSINSRLFLKLLGEKKSEIYVLDSLLFCGLYANLILHVAYIFLYLHTNSPIFLNYCSKFISIFKLLSSSWFIERNLSWTLLIYKGSSQIELSPFPFVLPLNLFILLPLNLSLSIFKYFPKIKIIPLSLSRCLLFVFARER